MLADGASEQRAGLPDGNETLLVAEDEEGVRTLMVRALRRAGYTVIDAVNGADALAKARTFDGRIHALVTDVVMPVMNGKVLAAQLGVERPGMRTLFVSGYADGTISRHGVLDAGVAFLAKPLTADTLVRKIREVLDASDEKVPAPDASRGDVP